MTSKEAASTAADSAETTEAAPKASTPAPEQKDGTAEATAPEMTEAEFEAAVKKSQDAPVSSGGWYNPDGSVDDGRSADSWIANMNLRAAGGSAAQAEDPAEIAVHAAAQLAQEEVDPLQFLAKSTHEDDDEEAEDEEETEDEEEEGEDVDKSLQDDAHEDARMLLNNFLEGRIEKAAGQGGLPESGVPTSLPNKQRPADGGGDVVFTQKPKAKEDKAKAAAEQTGAPSVPIEGLRFDDADLTLEDLVAGGMSWDPPHLRKSGPDMEARGRSAYLEQLAARQGVSLDIAMGVGVAPSTEPLEKSAPLSLDEYIEKSMEAGDGSLALSAAVGTPRFSPMLQTERCSACGQLRKSYLTVCEVCGTDHSRGAGLQEQPLGAEPGDIVI